MDSEGSGDPTATFRQRWHEYDIFQSKKQLFEVCARDYLECATHQKQTTRAMTLYFHLQEQTSAKIASQSWDEETAIKDLSALDDDIFK